MAAAEPAVIGRSRTAVESRSKVLGACPYVADLAVPGMAWAHLVRSTCPHGRIVAVEAEAARRVPGVLGVYTAADLRQLGMRPRFGPAYRDQSVLADAKTIYAGEPVAAVVAEDPASAEEAAGRVEVRYDPLPAVFDPLEAVRPGAPVIHQHLEPAGTFADLRHFLPAEGTNVCLHFKLRRGDADEALRRADLVVVAGEYTTPAVAHLPMEPHVAVAAWEPDGRLVCWTANQSPSFVRSELAYLFDLPESQVRVRVPYLGGGFGAKLYMKVEAAAAACARLAGRPVKLALSLEETFVTLTKHATRTRLRSGVTADGRIVARCCEVYWDGGACADIGPRIAQKSGFTAAGPYRIPHVRLDSYRVYTNKPPAGAFRGFGIPQLCWAYESHTDEIAAALGLDPVELRRRNVLRDGDVQAAGQRMEAAGFAPCLDAVERGMAAWPEPEAPVPGHRRGRGVALGMKAVLTPSVSTALVTLFADGSAAVATSTVDMGQGSDTVLGMLAAEALGCDPARVRVVHPDTDVTPYDTITAASRSTYHMGNAVLEAAGEVAQQLREIAAPHLEARVADLDLRDGAVVVRGAPARRLPFPEVMALRFGAAVGSLSGRGTCAPAYRPPDHETGQSERLVAFWFAAAAGVEVDVEEATGRIEVRRCLSVCDAGRALNPEAVEQQIVGGTVMQLGQTLAEEVRYEGGQALGASLLEYAVPTCGDVPAALEVQVVEVPQPDGPYGAKGVGESATFALSPAVANAVAQATGARLRDLPLTPERVWRGGRAAAGGTPS